MFPSTAYAPGPEFTTKSFTKMQLTKNQAPQFLNQHRLCKYRVVCCFNLAYRINYSVFIHTFMMFTFPASR